jgi:hypothetical protein
MKAIQFPGKAARVKTSAADGVGRDFYRVTIDRVPAAECPEAIVCHADVARFWVREVVPLGLVKDSGLEVLIAIYVGRKLEPLGWRLLGAGWNEVSYHQMPVLQGACVLGAYGVFFVHNHPSGDLKASRLDVEMRCIMAESLLAIGCKLIDSIIVTNDGGKSDTVPAWRPEVPALVRV